MYICLVLNKKGLNITMEQNLTKILKIYSLRERLSQLSQDFVQAMAGAHFEDLEERKAEFQTLHNELRVLEGKEPREYTKEENL